MELQQQVHQVVEQTKQRSGWPVTRTLAALGVAPRSYYRWQQVEQAEPLKKVKPVLQAYEATLAERAAVRAYALKQPTLRHRELAWRMIDEDVVCLSPSTVYRILREENLVCPWRRRSKRRREEVERAQRPDERWGTDLMYLRIGRGQYYLVTFLDEYSRYIIHWELLTSMDGRSVSLAAQAAIETLKDREGKLWWQPEIRSDNGPCYISHEFKQVLGANGLKQQRIKPHCPEENGLVERSNRTLREGLEEVELEDRQQALDVLRRLIAWYNHDRLHSALGYLRPADYYRGQPKELHEARRQKLARARHQRREANLNLRQPTLPWTDQIVSLN